jgi:protein ImuA
LARYLTENSVMSTGLDKLLQSNPALWRGRDNGTLRAGIETGFVALNVALPGGGWPIGALTEILSEESGIGELCLLMPALARLGCEDRQQAWIAPPFTPYAPALIAAGVNLSSTLFIQPERATDTLWAAEKTLRSGVCNAVLTWPKTSEFRALRRLQLAAEHGNCWGVVFRAAQFANHPSPAALRLRLHALDDGLRIDVLKARGGCRCQSVSLTL